MARRKGTPPQGLALAALAALLLLLGASGAMGAGEGAQERVGDRELHARRLLFDILSPVARAVGSVASYSINKLVIDPQREREVFKVWKELRELEEEEGMSESILPEAIRNTNSKQLSSGELHGAMQSSMNPVNAFAEQQQAPPLVLDPRMVIVSDECNETGMLTILFDGFTPDSKIVLYRSRLPAYNSVEGVRLPFDPEHRCGGTQIHLQGSIGLHPTKDTVKAFVATTSTQSGAAVVETFLRDVRMCEAFSYQAVDTASCLISNIVILSPVSYTPVTELKVAESSANPYVFSNELDLGMP